MGISATDPPTRTNPAVVVVVRGRKFAWPWNHGPADAPTEPAAPPPHYGQAAWQVPLASLLRPVGRSGHLPLPDDEQMGGRME